MYLCSYMCNLINFKNKEMEIDYSEISSTHVQTSEGVCHIHRPCWKYSFAIQHILRVSAIY